ncbi:hypothetical protein F442_13109 [Phytophthora nicotianae P10297]|uniref:Uncharacterized protein n=5 Tax=Phytophthora nicotianae TaxID=4792 RepID=V9DT06_PHYNI|nr:hypothetical protein F443_23093 [Phytophthora nicotianae P1569]ETL84323.1 hypothetical protein L917_15820 [Phytophthora nicotianae]ETP39429.1 hypothetical protein F442_13109 [Phytophthora nicotianae P10297]
MNRLASNPVIQNGIKIVKENPEMMKKVKSLPKDPRVIKFLQKPSSTKTVRMVHRTVSSRQKDEE